VSENKIGRSSINIVVIRRNLNKNSIKILLKMQAVPGIHLRSVAYTRFGEQPGQFPYTVPVIQSFDSLEFTAPVTFFVDENGCGKSTLLEALACAVGSITVGAESVETDQSLAALRRLGRSFKLAWNRKTRRGFFMRSEDFFGYARKLAATRQELQQDLQDVEQEYAHKSPTARAFARSAFLNELGALRRSYGEDLDARSHGESYLKLFQARFVPDGLYLLDEPEAPLSPLRQLSFLALLKSMLAQNAQFIIATHSPILLAYPGAAIWSFDSGQVRPAHYEDLEHVQITRTFLQDPQQYLRHLLK
jgi:predicted ATPase